MSVNKRVLAINFFLILTALIAYRQVGNNEFINLDDNDYIVENTHIQGGITGPGLYWAFTTGHAANWHPVTWISHMLDIQFFGLKPLWHHLTNLLFHIANALLLFFVLHRMTKALWKSAFVAALFALHPLHVESVAWAAERKDVLSTFFWMLTLAAYGSYARDTRFRRYLAVMALFALGLMAKPMLVTLPFVLLLLDFWPLDRFGGSRFRWRDLNQQPSKSVQPIQAEVNSSVAPRRKKGKTGKPPSTIAVEVSKPANCELHRASIRALVLEKIPLLALTTLSCVATYIVQNRAGSVASGEVYAPGVRIANALVSYLNYFTGTIWPENLAVFYPYPGALPTWQVAGASVFLLAITVAVILRAKKFPYLPVGWLWFAGTLIPVIGIVQVGSQAMADRYTYIPSIGLFIMAAWGIPEIFKKRRYGKEVLAVGSALCLLCFLILTRTQVEYWRDSITLYDHALNVTRNNHITYNNRGKTWAFLGAHTRAIEDFNRAVEINPQYAAAYTGRGLAYYNTGNQARAIEDFDKAIAINPLYAAAFNGRGLVYYSTRNFSRAIEDFDRAIRIDSQSAMAYNNRGNARDDLGDHAGAIEDFSTAVAINPRDANAHFNRGITYNAMGKYTEAIEDFNRAIAINPGYAAAYYNRGKSQGFLGNQKQALEDLKTAARLGSMDAGKTLKSQGIGW